VPCHANPKTVPTCPGLQKGGGPVKLLKSLFVPGVPGGPWGFRKLLGQAGEAHGVRSVLLNFLSRKLGQLGQLG
jgi:hypothetical protein